MPSPPPDHTPAAPSARIPEERVHAALRRAAQLQVEAADRLERQARVRIQAHPASPGDTPGLAREEVEAAAVEAGISAEYIRQALLEQEALGEHAEELAPWIDRMGNRMLGSRRRSIDLVRVVEAPPAAVLDSMQRVFPSYAYGLTLVDSVGGLPLEGGVMVFQIPRLTLGSTAYTSFAYNAYAVDLLQIQVSLRALERPTGVVATEITLRGDLRTSTRRNVWAGLGAAGIGGAVGGMMAVGAALASGAVIPIALAGAAAGAAGLGWLGGKGYGLAYRYYLRKTIAELETLLKVVDTNARTGGSFQPPLPPPPGSGGSTYIPVITG